MKKMMLKAALLVLYSLVTFRMVVGYPQIYNDDYDIWRRELEEKLEERGASDFCAKWGDYCVPDSKIEFAKCCASLRCSCGSAIFGSDHNCQCKRESIFG